MDREGGGSNGGSSYYSVLGIRSDASSSDIRTAYRKLAMVILIIRCRFTLLLILLSIIFFNK
jgi:hypothetical protein